jgi:hypothetical protein
MYPVRRMFSSSQEIIKVLALQLSDERFSQRNARMNMIEVRRRKLELCCFTSPTSIKKFRKAGKAILIV